MKKNLLSLSIMFFGICILFGAWFISSAVQKIAYSQQGDTVNVPAPDHGEWELIVVNENNILLFNNISGEYWRKFIESGEGPTNWERQPLPWENN
jgi:hypothetical protein